MKKKYLVILASLLLTCQAFAKEYSNPSKPVIVTKEKPDFEVVLDANRSAGYAWFMLPFPREYFEIKSHKYISKDGLKLGAPGRELWEIHTKPEAFETPMALPISFLYIRAWEREPMQKAEFVVMTSD